MQPSSLHENFLRLGLNVERRTSVLSNLEFFDTPPDAEFDSICRIAAFVAKTSFATIGFQDGERYWFKAKQDIPFSELEIDKFLRALALENSKSVSILENVPASKEFQSLPDDSSHLQIQFYAGFPICIESKFAIGTLSVFDTIQKDLSEEQIAILRDLARQVEVQLKHRLNHSLLRESENLILKQIQELNQIFENAAYGFHSVDETGTILRMNKTELEWFGKTREEVVGKIKIYDLVPEKYKLLFQEKVKQIQEGKSIHEMEFSLLKNDGTTRHITLSSNAVKNIEGKFLMTNSILLDITERRQSEKQIESLAKTLTLKQEQFMEQLSMGRRIQESFIPKNNPLPNMAVYYEPLEQVGGDFFDFRTFEDKKMITILVADVAGHGIPSALITAMLKSKFQSIPEKFAKSPDKILEFLNEDVEQYLDNRFITAIVAFLNMETREIILANAGHPDPHIREKNGNVYPLIADRRPPLGVMDNVTLLKLKKPYVHTTFQVSPGSLFHLYTDGLIEARKQVSSSEFVVYENELVDVLKSIPDLDSGFIEVKHIVLLEAFKQFTSETDLEDDVCSILIEFD